MLRLRNMLKMGLYFLFLYLPDPLLYCVISIVAYLRSLYRIVTHFNIEVEFYEGYRNGSPVKVLWIGTDDMKAYILERLYGAEYQVTALKSTNCIYLQETLKSLSVQADIIYIEMNSLLPPLKGFSRMQQAVITRMRLDQRNSKKYRETKRIIEKHGIEFRNFKISQNIEQFQLFYDQLYVPHISSKWGENSVETFDAMKIFYAKGVLQLAYHKDEVIAGSIFLCQGETLVKCKYGVLDAQNRLHRIAASYYGNLKYAEEHNFIYFSDFHVKPFINDGLFRYKREWGLHINRERRNYYFDKDIYFKVSNYNPGIVDFLSKEPFIVVQNNELVANLLCPGEIPSLVDEIVCQYHNACTGGIAQYEFSVGQELSDQEKGEIYQRCGVSEEENILRFINYNRAEIPIS